MEAYFELLQRVTSTSTSGDCMERHLNKAANQTYLICGLQVCFTITTNHAFKLSYKDAIPGHQKSNFNVINPFQCRRGCRYVGKNIQRLDTRIKQHIPAYLTKTT